MPTATPTRRREFRKAASTAALALLVVMGAAAAFSVHLVVSSTDELAHAVTRTSIDHNGRTLAPVTLSIGLAVFPADGVTPEVLFEVADVSLHQAKAEGRHRVVRATRIT